MNSVTFNYSEDELQYLRDYLSRFKRFDERELSFEQEIIDLRIEMHKKLIMPFYEAFFADIYDEIVANEYQRGVTVNLLKSRIPALKDDDKFQFAEALAELLFVNDGLEDETYFIQVSDRFISEEMYGATLPGHLADFDRRKKLNKV